MGDPKQLLRIVGTAVKLYPDADQFYQHENVKNLYVYHFLVLCCEGFNSMNIAMLI